MIRKISLISKFRTSQPGKQIIAIHILLNISKSKGNQAIKFGKLTEYNMRNIFLEKSFTKFGEESKLIDYLWIILYNLLLVYAKSGLSKYIKSKLQNNCIYFI